MFAAPLAGASLGRATASAYALVAAVAFAVASVAVYFVNDVVDASGTGGIRSSGTAPIASGELPKAHAVAVAAVLRRSAPWPRGS